MSRPKHLLVTNMRSNDRHNLEPPNHCACEFERMSGRQVRWCDFHFELERELIEQIKQATSEP